MVLWLGRGCNWRGSTCRYIASNILVTIRSLREIEEDGEDGLEPDGNLKNTITEISGYLVGVCVLLTSILMMLFLFHVIVSTNASSSKLWSSIANGVLPLVLLAYV